AQTSLELLPIGDEVVEVQHGWPVSSRQTSNERPRAVNHEDSAIIVVALLGHADGLQTGTQPLCEHCCKLVVLSPEGVIVIGSRPLAVATVNE
ncbi:hypothetical protein AOG23_35000, partial [Rhizobium acidisoli]